MRTVRRSSILSAVLIGAVLGGGGDAQAQQWPPPGPAPFSVAGVNIETMVTPVGPNEWDLIIVVPQSPTNQSVTITSESENLRFSRIEVRSQSGGAKPQVTLTLAGNPPIQYIGTLGENETDQFGAHVTLEGDTNQTFNVGEIRFLGVTRIGSIIVGGNLGGVDSVTGAGTPVVVKQYINGLTVLGNLHANLVVQGNGLDGVSIYDLEVRGAIGQSGQQNIGRIWTKGDIDEIVAGVIYSPIEPGFLATPPGTRKYIRNLTCSTDPGFTGGGHFKGWLIADKITREVRINGDLDGYIDLSGGIDDHNLHTPTGPVLVPTLFVDGSFLDGVQGPDIVLPANGLRGQIVFNAVTPAPGNWEGTIAVGGVTLASAEYSALPSQIGGGAAGRAPYIEHGEACSPQDGQIILVGPAPWQIGEDCGSLNPQQAVTVYEAYLQLYGPVFDIVSTNIKVRMRPQGSDPTAWIDVSSQYRVTFESTQTAGALRRLKIYRADSGDFPTDYIFEISAPPEPNTLRCDHAVNGSGQNPRAEFVYTFSTRWVCDEFDFLVGRYDVDGDNAVNLSDVSSWVADPQDFTNDTVADGVDLNHLFNAVVNFANLPPRN